MADELSVQVGDDRITVTLPDADQSVIPTIPEELREDVPPFVVEWVLEADEIATVVQELLQAPTRSLCRAMASPNANIRGEFDPLTGQPALRFRSPTPPVLQRGGGFDVAGFAAADGTVPGLPEGIRLPEQLLDTIAMCRKLDGWISKGQRVTEWAMEQGKADLTWMPAATA